MRAPPVYHRLSATEQRALLTRVVERSRAKKGAPVPLVVFDLDGTLMDNRPRTALILQELAAELRAEAHSSADLLAATKVEDIAYLLRESLKIIGVEHAELVERAESFWRDRFFSDAYLKHDVAIAGAVTLAQACYAAGATLVYFTGRDLPLMSLGSFQSLRDLGFPIGVIGTELVCKPDAKIPDEHFKREEAPKLARIGEVVATFDNEPGNCNAFLELFPDAENVFVDTQHLPGAPALAAKVHVVPDLSM
ncbi:MAG: HAD family hydrolase [Labilithrix sp.]|nr:HAD family hydrolase [Labilithrix sp.]MCW5810602.1 HAD family hydrolase [Labilithrix sp.]